MSRYSLISILLSCAASLWAVQDSVYIDKQEYMAEGIVIYEEDELPDSLFITDPLFEDSIWEDPIAMDSIKQDSLQIDSVCLGGKYAGVYADTIRLQDLPSTADLDRFLLDIVAQQGRALYLKEQFLSDSVRADSTILRMTVADILYRDSVRLQAYRDSIELDSLKRENARLREKVHDIPLIHIKEKSLVKDEVEDRKDYMRAIRNMYTPWHKEAKIIVQMTQNYATKNWSQGGGSTFAILSVAKGSIGYYSDKFTWENTGEWRAGSSTVSGDSLRKMNMTDDLFRLYSKTNYKMFNKLFYSISAEFETHFFNTYTENSSTKKSGPFSPLRLNLALGIDYKPIEGLSISFSPLAYKLVHVGDTTNMKQTDFGVPMGHKTLNDVGSSLRIEYVWKPVREIVIENKFYMYTNYKRVEIDWEINCDFIINRFFSARLLLHPRYDNTVIYTGDEKAKIQFRELLSIGIAHHFR